MGQLGDFLEVLYGPEDRFHTIRATIHCWLDHEVAARAEGQGVPAFGRKKTGAEKPSKSPKISESTLSIWLSLPARARIEKRRKIEDSIETELVVVNGDRRWECDSEGHVETSVGQDQRRRAAHYDAIDTDLDRHFEPGLIRQFFGELALEARGPVRTAGRDCVRVRAVLRPGCRLWPHWLPKEADEYEFHADLERGVLLAIISRYKGEAFELLEARDIAFDEPMDDEIFVYQPSPGEQVGPKTPIVERLTLAAAIARMPFTVLVPTRIPDPEHSSFEVMYHPPQKRKRWPHLALMYHGGEAYGHLWVHEGDRPDPNRQELEWEAIEHGGTAVKDLGISDPGEGLGLRIVAFEQTGTHVQILSDLSRHRLVDFAMSFIAALPNPSEESIRPS